MVGSTYLGLLVATAGLALRRQPRLPRALAAAVLVAAITVTADPGWAMAPRAGEPTQLPPAQRAQGRPRHHGPPHEMMGTHRHLPGAGDRRRSHYRGYWRRLRARWVSVDSGRPGESLGKTMLPGPLSSAQALSGHRRHDGANPEFLKKPTTDREDGAGVGLFCRADLGHSWIAMKSPAGRGLADCLSTDGGQYGAS